MPDSADLLEQLSASLAAQHWSRLEQLCQQFESTQPDHPAASSFRCQAAVAQGRWEQAGQIAQEITERWPDNPSAWLNRARIERVRGRNGAALAALRRGLVLKPQAPMMLMEAAALFREEDQLESAHLAAAAAFAVAPDLAEAYRYEGQPPQVLDASRCGNEILRDWRWERMMERLRAVEADCGCALPRMNEFVQVFLGRKPI